MSKKFYKRTPKKDAVTPGAKWNPAALPRVEGEIAQIVDAIRSGYSVMVEACAGSGKTTGVKIVSANTNISTKNCRYFAFNKSVQQEAVEALPSWWNVTTFHGAGFELMRSCSTKRYNVNASKLTDLMDSKGERITKSMNLGVIEKLVRISRINIALNQADVERVAQTYNILANPSEIAMAWELIDDCDQITRITGEIDFDDMLRIPILMDYRLEAFDFIAVDEAQDLSPAAVEIVKRVAKPNCQYLIIGDPMQGIYGFAGATIQSLYNLTVHANAKQYMLSTCWRCPKEIIKLANEVEGSNRTKAKPDAIDGKFIEYESMSGIFEIITGEDLVLARTRASLVTFAMYCYKNGIPFRAVFDNIFKRFANTLYGYWKCHHQNLPFSEALKLYIEEFKDSEDAENGSLDPESDDVACTLRFAEGLLSVNVLDQFQMYTIADALATNREGVTISTIHRAKGLEAKNVVLLDPHLLPHPRAVTQTELEQERNLKYVATTRALETLGVF